MGVWKSIKSATRAAVETYRYTLQNPSEEMKWGFLGGLMSHSGIPINRHTALTLGTVWQAVTLISYDVAKIPLLIYQRNGDGKKRATAHPAYKLLKHAPNPYQTPIDFWASIMTDALLGHGGYILIERDALERPLQLIRLRPDRVCCESYEDMFETLGRRYIYRLPDKREVTFAAKDVIAVHGLTWDSLCGYDWSQQAKQSIGYGLALEEYGNRFFSNGAEPKLVITTDRRIDKEAMANAKASWDSAHQGLDNAHKTAILQMGMDVKQISIDPRNAQMIEAKQYSVREIASWFNLPPHKLGDDSRTSHNSLEMEDRSYAGSTLDRWWTTIEQQCSTKLLSSRQQERDTHLVEYLREAAVRTDLTARTLSFQAGLAGHSYLTVNEVRSMQNLNPVPGGDVIKPPTNNFLDPGDLEDNKKPEDDDPPDDAPPAPEPEEDDERMLSPGSTPPVPGRSEIERSIFQKELKRAIYRITKDARANARSGKKLMKWIDQVEEKQTDPLLDYLTEPLLLITTQITAPDLVAQLIGEVRAFCLDVAGNVNTDEQLLKWVDAGLEEFEPTFFDKIRRQIF